MSTTQQGVDFVLSAAGGNAPAMAHEHRLPYTPARAELHMDCPHMVYATRSVCAAAHALAPLMG
jgi:hypothetical protein